MNVLFVCTGNTCRSPMAEAIYNYLIQRDGKTGEARSAGLSVFFSGAPANDKSERALNNLLGIDAPKDGSKPVDEALMQWADVIVGMERMHRDALKNAYPKHADRVTTLYEWARQGDGDVDDPFGAPQNVYDDTARRLLGLIEAVLSEEEN